MWELRTRERVHTSSALMCWAACDRLARMAARLGGLYERVGHWRLRADTIRERILAEAWNAERGHFADAFGGERLDASLLLLADLGFVEARDPRFVATVEAIGRDLKRGHGLFRYIAPDDFGAPETSFTICTFWYIDALARTGRAEEARELFEGMLESRNHVGLLSEDIAPESGEHWGNYPQTYSLVGIVNAATRLSRHWEAFT
jgi:pentatricopeptide repeat protein